MSDKKQYERAKKLFQIARKMEPSERDKFLNNECQSDESLLIEVKSLLDFDSPETLISKPLKHDETLAHLSDVTIRKANETRFLSKHLDSTTIIKLFKDRSRKRLLVIGLVSLFVFGLGFLLHQTIEFALKRNLQEGLQAILNADVEGVKEGLNEIKLVVSNMAEEKAFQQSIQQINKFAKDNRLSKDISKQIRDIYPFETTLNRLLVVLRGENYFVVNRTGQFLISNDDKKVGQYLPQEQLSQMSPVFQGESKVIFPKPDKSQLENRTAPNIWGLAPVRDAEDKIIAVLCIGISTDAKFFKLLKIARLGKTGETYAFNKEGYLISESRFTEQLKEIGMIPNKPDSKAIFRVQVRDPGGDLTAGYEPDVQMEARPLTVMAASAIEGKTDFNGEGYRDYRGVTVIGVWTWIPEYSIGITTEVDYTEAYKPLVPVTWLFWLAAIGMTGVVIGLVLSVMRIDKLEHNLEDLQQLGAYVLEEKMAKAAWE